MGSENPFRLPVIDLSKQDMKPGTNEWESMKGQVRQALEEFGCFHALFDQAHLELRKAIIGALEDLFDLPQQTKMKYLSKNFFDGYIGQRPGSPLHEMMGISNATIPEKVEGVANTFWPDQGNPSFSKTVQSFTEQVSMLDQTIRRMILESFGLENHIDKHIESTNYVFRAVKYKEPNSIKTELGVGAHFDSNILTILYHNDVDGLEAQTKDGKWINVQPSPNCCTVIIGETLSAMLNGRLFAPNHRVMMNGNKARYTAGLFSTLKGGYLLETPKEMVDEEHLLLFKPFDYCEYLKHFQAKARQGIYFSLKEYCSL